MSADFPIKPDSHAACAAHALALRAIIRYQEHRETASFEGGADLLNEPLPDLAPNLPNANALGKLYDAHMAAWIPEAGEGEPRAQELYIELVKTILIDEMTEAEGLCGDDYYHAITLLAALKPTFFWAGVKEAVKAERARRKTTAATGFGEPEPRPS
jgi:hypothetical protein